MASATLSTPLERRRPVARSADPMAAYKRVLTIGMVLNVLGGLWMIVAPGSFTAFLNMDPVYPLAWVRYAGVSLIVLTGTYIPVRLLPLANRFLAAYGIALRFVFVLFFVLAGGGFLWFALFDFIFGVLLFVTYWRGWLRDLMAKP